MAKKESSILIPMLTKWGEKLNPNAPLQQYPRPQLWRQSCFNLNGVWQYAIRPEQEDMPYRYDGDIIVPFSPESILSGVSRNVKSGEVLWYSREFYLPIGFMRERVILNFGAVDQCCTVYINKKPVGEHEGGYLPFSFDITNYLTGGKNSIQLEVYDDTAKSIYTYGKQSQKRGEIWYTAQSGIWQTVWMESVADVYVKDLKITPVFDESKVEIKVTADSIPTDARVEVSTRGIRVASGFFDKNGFCSLKMLTFVPWSPSQPFLYDVRIYFGLDRVESYFGMRKFSVEKDAYGNMRFMLNNSPIFLSGLLDQGYWSDGLYTAPSDEALIFDIKNIKDMGFNMVRKHIKVEPLRWYYHCDRLGLIVFQDMPSGGEYYKAINTQVLPFLGIQLDDSKYRKFGRRQKNGRTMFEAESYSLIDKLYNITSIAAWVPFNEGWGQFDALRISEEIWDKDKTRLVDHASGWHDQGGGDFKSVHVYYKKIKLKSDKKRILALTECGGYSLAIQNHIPSTRPFGYKMYTDSETLLTGIDTLFTNEILPHIKKGLCVSVYTQLSDVEDEVNGLLTFDRKYQKLEPFDMYKINQKLYSEAENVITMQLPQTKKHKKTK